MAQRLVLSLASPAGKGLRNEPLVELVFDGVDGCMVHHTICEGCSANRPAFGLEDLEVEGLSWSPDSLPQPVLQRQQLWFESEQELSDCRGPAFTPCCPSSCASEVGEAGDDLEDVADWGRACRRFGHSVAVHPAPPSSSLPTGGHREPSLTRQPCSILPTSSICRTMDSNPRSVSTRLSSAMRPRNRMRSSLRLVS